MNSELDYSYLGDPTDRMRTRRWIVTGVLGVYGVLLIVLFALYASVSDCDGDCSSSTVTGAVGTFQTAVSFSQDQVGLAASLSSSGVLQLGAGTSVYKDLYQLPGVCAKATAMEPVFESSYVMSFIDGVKDSTTVSILQADSSRDLELSSSTEYEKQLAAISTLDAGRGLLVGVAQDVSETQDEAVVVALRVEDGQTVTFGAETKYGGMYSVNPQVTRLSAATFAITYLDNVTLPDGSWSYSALTRYGAVAADLSISLSDPVIFASDDNYELQTSVVGLSDSSFLLVMNTAELQEDDGPHYGPLTARVATVTGEGAAVVVTLGAVSSYQHNFASFNMASARVDNSSALVSYCDYNNNYGISVVALQAGADGDVALTASLQLTSGQALSVVQDMLQMDLDIETFGGDQFVVTYSDISNSGTLTVAAGALSASAELSRTSPDLLLSAGNEQLDSLYQWQAVAVREASEALNAEIAIASSLQGLTCDLSASSLSVSMMHVLPAPLGLVQTASHQEGELMKASALLSGWVDGYQQLVPGMLYYSNTFGELTSAGVFFGQEGEDFYVTDEASSTLMTALVGVAVSDTTLLLKV